MTVVSKNAHLRHGGLARDERAHGSPVFRDPVLPAGAKIRRPLARSIAIMLHQIVRGGERRQLMGRAVGERHRRELRYLASGQAELDPPAEHRAGGDAMAGKAAPR
ncbi:hypothetical protein [Bradyrhizobium sp. USDA 3315]